MTDTAKITHINTRRYWTITEHGKVHFTGTFLECWEKLVANYGNIKLADIAKSGIQIERRKI